MLKGTLLGVGDSDEVHEDVVLHDAGLQARLGDRAPGTPAQQHLTWGAVGKGLHLPVIPGAREGPGPASSFLLWEPQALSFLRSPGGTHQRDLWPHQVTNTLFPMSLRCPTPRLLFWP